MHQSFNQKEELGGLPTGSGLTLVQLKKINDLFFFYIYTMPNFVPIYM